MNPWIPHLLRAGGGGGGPVLPPAGRTMLANLTSSLILDEGTGAPTWSRATKAWGINELGYLVELASGCAFFGGARLVRNLVPTPSNTLAVAGTKTVTLTQAATLQFSMGAGAGTATFSGTGGATGALAAGASRVSVNKTVTAGSFIVTASVDALVDLSIVDVTNYDASYVPEYVSVGSDTNKNFLLHTDDFSQAAWSKTNITPTQSAIANPVNGRIDAQKIEATVGAATQLIQTVTGAGSASGMALVLYVKKGSGATDMQTFALRNNTTATNVLGGRINYDTGVITYYAGSSGITAVDVGNGWWKLSLISATGFSAGDNIAVYLGSNGSAETAGEFCYIYRPYLGRGTTVPAVLPAVAGVWDPFGAGIDGAKYFETDWQGAPIAAANLLKFRREVSALNNLLHSRDLSNAAWSTKTNITAAKTATGLDGIADTATTLTATAADAIILQPITLVSAARCASAYVKRRTGTGTISFTQDGGSTWTDITSQINGSTWSRVEITATLANPSVGFKLSTSGDAIDVDCAQNEAGAVATSPIVTTTAAVTRNAESLTYQTASNWSDAAGTAYIEAQPLAWVAGGAIGSATNGLLLSAANSGATASDGTNTANGPAGSPSGRKKLALRWGGGAMTVASGGVVGTPGTYDGAMGLASIGIAVNSSTYCGPVAIYNYQMTDAELQALTT